MNKVPCQTRISVFTRLSNMQLSKVFRSFSCLPFSFLHISRNFAIASNLVARNNLTETVKNKDYLFLANRYCSQEWNVDVEEVLRDDNYVEFSDRMFRLPQHGHNVLVLQPFLKYNRVPLEDDNTVLIKLKESVALIETLPKWNVADAIVMGVPNYNKTNFIGTGQMDRLRETVNSAQNISAVFVSVNILKVKQIMSLELALNMPIFDRYTIVIQIFREHAVTKESKLQVAMAELPYLRQCVKGFPKGLSDRLSAGGIIGGTGSLYVQNRKELLNQREQKLKKAISSLRKHRERLRSNKRQTAYPVVAVVGYTNAGKTSFIKAVTGAEKLQPRNQLFATLDVTKHEGLLPCKLKVLYVDTVGFITDIPTDLMESFTATLEDAIHADVIVHIWDVSHPNFLKQREHVMITLKKLNFGESLPQKLFFVGNKVDCIPENTLLEVQRSEPSTFFVSTKNGFGMQAMLLSLQRHILKVSGWFKLKIRVKIGAEEYNWLHKEVTIEDMEIESDQEHVLLSVVTTRDKLQTFKHKFIKQQ